MDKENVHPEKLRLLVVQPEVEADAPLYIEALDKVLLRMQAFELSVEPAEADILQAIRAKQPDILLIIAAGEELPRTCSIPEIMEVAPGLPILWTGIGSPSIHIYTSRRLPARSHELRVVLEELAGEHRAEVQKEKESDEKNIHHTPNGE